MSNMTELANELNELIDKRIELYMKSVAYVKKAYAVVQSYNGTSKATTVRFPSDTTDVVYKNLSNDTLVSGDTVVVLFANGSNLSTGHIYGKIST